MKFYSILLILLLISCTQNKNTTTTIETTTPSPIAGTATPTPTDTPEALITCPQSEEQLNQISPDQIVIPSGLPITTKKSSVRIIGKPGINGSECGVATGIVFYKKNNEIIVVFTGEILENAQEYWIKNQQATIIGKSKNPNILVLRVTCKKCDDIETTKIAKNKEKNLLIIGYTDGSENVIGHPARIADSAYNFQNIGNVDTWVYTLVPDGTKNGDGIWTKDGKLIGISYQTEVDTQRPTAYRTEYIPASDLQIAANASFFNKNKE